MSFPTRPKTRPPTGEDGSKFYMLVSILRVLLFIIGILLDAILLLFVPAAGIVLAVILIAAFLFFRSRG